MKSAKIPKNNGLCPEGIRGNPEGIACSCKPYYFVNHPCLRDFNVHRSLLIELQELKHCIIMETELLCLQKAVMLWGNAQPLTSRQLMPSDLGYNKFVETSNSVTGWNMMAAGRRVVPCATVIGIYGLKIKTDTDLVVPISGIRLDVAGSRVAQWVIYPPDTVKQVNICDEDDLSTMIAIPRVLVSEDQTMAFYEYTQIVNVVYYPIWAGIVVEKRGVTII